MIAFAGARKLSPEAAEPREGDQARRCFGDRMHEVHINERCSKSFFRNCVQRLDAVGYKLPVARASRRVHNHAVDVRV